MPNSIRLGRYHLNLENYLYAEESASEGNGASIVIVMPYGVRLTFTGPDNDRLRLRLAKLDDDPDASAPGGEGEGQGEGRGQGPGAQSGPRPLGGVRVEHQPGPRENGTDLEPPGGSGEPRDRQFGG